MLHNSYILAFGFNFIYLERRSAQCTPPFVRADCKQGGQGLECARTCQNLDLPCVSLACIPGCLCPPGKVGARARVVNDEIVTFLSGLEEYFLNIFRYVTAETALHLSSAPVTITTGHMHRDKASLWTATPGKIAM